MTSEILHHWDLNSETITVDRFGNGLINNTWLVQAEQKKYILQQINHHVFLHPEAIDDNINAIRVFLRKHFPNYLFVAPVFSRGNKSLIKKGEDYFRLFDFIESSHSYTVLQNPQLAFEASKQFGRFTKLLADFDIDKLQITLPNFHDLTLRYRQFIDSLQQASSERLNMAKEITAALQQYNEIVEIYNAITIDPSFKKRVTHHDTKISNVLFDENNEGICIVDLDTVMPGYFISDVGDMMRTYLSSADEEETDFSKINIRDEYFEAIVQGYLNEMQTELSSNEKQNFVYAGKFMIYMQALRFITDYLSNDIYYGAKYPLHNFNRAINQLTLLQILISKEDEFNERVANFLHAKE
jgi:Ser/Thr protein kinase RdoA (MazF antagonist)